jgi:predicted acylesterase/phospholipase RssA
MLDGKVSEALEWLRIAKDKFREFASGNDAERTVRPKIGLALAGGFARGIAHIGVLRAFRDAGIPIDCVAGTSVGALIGAGFCSGISLDRMQQIGQSTTFAVLPPTSAWKNISLA